MFFKEIGSEIGVKFVILEITIYTILFMLVGYFLNPEDPLFIQSSLNPYLLFILVITLYYGLEAGLLSFLFEAGAMWFLYKSWNVPFLLWSLLYVLVAAEFHFFWTKKIRATEEENAYFKDRLRRQASDFILLKLSHDQLEKNYLLKPLSIRTVIREIKEILKSYRSFNEREVQKRLFGKLREFLTAGFYVEEGALFLKEGEEFKLMLSLGEVKTLNLADPMFRQALVEKNTVFVSKLSADLPSDYLAVIPIYDFSKEDELLGVFVIKKMPFSHFNADNILSLSVVFFWLLNELRSCKLVEELPGVLRVSFGYDFLKELTVMESLYKRTGVESALVVYKISELEEDFKDFLSERVRGLDIVSEVKLKKERLIFVLLPLSSVAAAKGFVNRIKKDFVYLFGEEELPYRILKVDEKIGKKVEQLIVKQGKE